MLSLPVNIIMRPPNGSYDGDLVHHGRRAQRA